MKKVFLEISKKFTGKHLCQSLFFNKAAGLRPATLLKKRLWHRCFLVNFSKFLRTPFSQNTSGRLLLMRIWKAILFSLLLQTSYFYSLHERFKCTANKHRKLNFCHKFHSFTSLEMYGLSIWLWHRVLQILMLVSNFFKIGQSLFSILQ